MKKFFVLLIAAALFVACGDESSSSAPASDPSEESSSSIEKTNESSSSATTKNSSSSVGGDKNSSSVKKENSSSSVVKASSSSAAPKSSSSEEVKQSSSSVVASSSSEEEESSSSYDRTIAFKGVLWRAGDYIKFVDPRNSREYYYIQIDGKDTAGKAASIKVMAENLNIGDFVWGHKDQKDDAKIEKYCYYDDTTNCNNYGGLYQWAEMMQLPSRCNTESCADLIKPNHQGICPNGWRLLTYNDYYIAVHADNNKDGVKGTRSAYGFGGSNDSGFSLVGAGYNWNHSFTSLQDGTYWFYPVESAVGGDQFVHASFQYTTAKGNPDEEVYKIHGFSVRCVMVE